MSHFIALHCSSLLQYDTEQGAPGLESYTAPIDLSHAYTHDEVTPMRQQIKEYACVSRWFVFMAGRQCFAEAE